MNRQLIKPEDMMASLHISLPHCIFTLKNKKIKK